MHLQERNTLLRHNQLLLTRFLERFVLSHLNELGISWGIFVKIYLACFFFFYLRCILCLQVNIDFEKEPMGTNKDGKKLYLRDIWPSSEEVTQVHRAYVFHIFSIISLNAPCDLTGSFEQAFQNTVLQSMFKSTYETMTKRNSVSLSSALLYSWDSNSTYIHEPPFFKNITTKPPGPREVKDAY